MTGPLRAEKILADGVADDAVFLGHADGNITDEHYADAPESLLDRAVGWLREELGIDKMDLTHPKDNPAK